MCNSGWNDTNRAEPIGIKHQNLQAHQALAGFFYWNNKA
jgi:hypothetical protein